MKRIAALTLALLMVLGCAGASACTGFYVGRDASESGYCMFGHTVDLWTTAQGNVVVTDRVENVPGRTFRVAEGVEFPLPDTTYKYTAMPAIDGTYDSSVVNEMGVGISSSVTCYVSEEIAAMDPVTEHGLSELFMNKLVGMCAATAREGIGVLVSYIEMFGNAEQNSIVIADQNEAWYMETYTGRQWCAVKCPDDCVAVYGNNFMLRHVDPDSEDVLCSEGLFSMPEEAGLARYAEDGRFDLFATYSGDYLRDTNTMRTWYGRVMFAPSTAGEFESGAYYGLFYRPDEPVSLGDLFTLSRSRYEGTAYCPEGEVELSYPARIIGVEKQVGTGVIELRHDLPPAMAGTTWICMADAEHSVFLPVNALTGAVAEGFRYIPAGEGPDENLAHYRFKRLGALCKLDRARFGLGVREYWSSVEKTLLEKYPMILDQTLNIYGSDPEKAEAFITDFTVSTQEKAVAAADEMFNELIWHVIDKTYYSKELADMEPYVPSAVSGEVWKQEAKRPHED